MFVLLFIATAAPPAANRNEPSGSSHLQIDNQPLRRRSEGDAQPSNQESTTPHAPAVRRTSLDSSDSRVAVVAVTEPPVVAPEPPPVEMVKCRYPRCESTTTLVDARRYYKSCHNCAHMYCSRECRRAHWERHRRGCLHSRVSVLCRQVLAMCKDDEHALRHLTILARSGFTGQGRGVVRVLFRSPENAELFVRQGYQRIGEASYVRWPELLPQEMGPDLYSELLRLSTEYKPDSKMLLYVAICVVSETPSATAPVKWERQLVSRCAKLKLSKLVADDMPLVPAHVQMGLQQGLLQHYQNQIPSVAPKPPPAPPPVAAPTVPIPIVTNSHHHPPQQQPSRSDYSAVIASSSSSSSSAVARPSTSVAPSAAPSTAESSPVIVGKHQGTGTSDILILTFNTSSRQLSIRRNRQYVVDNVQNQLRMRGVSLQRHYPEVFQRLTLFIECAEIRLMPVTINPKDIVTGRAFTCIIIPNMGELSRITTAAAESEQTIELVDCMEGLPPE